MRPGVTSPLTFSALLAAARDSPKTAFGFQCLSRSAIAELRQVDSSGTLAQFYRIPRERCADRHGIPSSSQLVTTVYYYSVLSQSEASRTAETAITIYYILYTSVARLNIIISCCRFCRCGCNMGVLILNVDTWVAPPKKKWIRHYLLEEPLLSNKDAGYHPTSVTLPSSDLPASLNHIEPPITPPRQQQQSQQQLHQQATPVALQQQHPQQLQLQLHQPQQQTPQQQQQLQLQLHQPVQQHHAVYKPAVTATAVAVTAANNNNNTTAVALVNSHDENVAALSLAQELKRRTGSGTREVHNKLEKNRRAHLKECFELLKKQVPASQDEKKTSNLSILRSAIRYIQVLRRRERELEHEMERLAREKIWAQQRHASLKKELAAKWDHIDFSKLLPDLPPDVTTRKTTIAATSINGDFETERDASMVTSDADDSKLSALYSSTSSLSSSSPPTLPFVSDIIPHQVQVVSTSPMMGSTIHIVPQTRNSSSLPPNALQQQTLTFVHHKDALNQHDGTTQAVLTKVSNGSFTLYGDPKLTPNRSKMSLAGIKIGTSVIDHSNNTASAPIRLLQNNIIAAQTSVVNRGQPTPNHVITRPLLLTHHHTNNSAPAHLVLSTASSKAVTIPNQQLPPLSNGHLIVKPSAMVVMNSSQPKSHHSGHKA